MSCVHPGGLWISVDYRNFTVNNRLSTVVFSVNDCASVVFRRNPGPRATSVFALYANRKRPYYYWHTIVNRGPRLG